MARPWNEVAAARLTEAATHERRTAARYRAERADEKVVEGYVALAEVYERGAKALLQLGTASGDKPHG